MPLLEIDSSQTIPLPSEDASEDGWLLDVYYPSVKMSSYLVAVVVTWDYQSLQSNLVEGGPITKVNIQLLFHDFRARSNVLVLRIISMNSSLSSHSTGVDSL